MTKPIPPTIERITPRQAITLLVHGLLSDEDAASLRPTKVPVETLIRMLHDANEIRNRRITLPTVQRYARDMSNNHWHYTGDPIKIDKNGFVRDGQHRLLALILSGTTQWFAIQRGIHPDVQLVVDIGRSRRAADQLRIQGVTNYTNAAAGAALWLRWKAGRVLDSGFQASVPEISEVALTNPHIEQACVVMQRVRHNLRYAPAAGLVASYIEASEIDAQFRDAFYDKLATGVGIGEDDPIGVLRNNLSRYQPHRTPVKFGQRGLFWMVVYAWNKSRKNEQIKTIRVPWNMTSKTFPNMV